MGKISSYAENTSPATADFLLGNTTSTSSTSKFKISNIALTIATFLFSSQIQTFSNTASAGGTFYYLSVGGLKLLWGQTTPQTTAGNFGGTTSYAINLPANFFTNIQYSSLTGVNPQGTANQFIVPTLPSVTSISGFWMQSGAVSGATIQGSLFMIGN